MTISELMYGKNDRRALLIDHMISNRASLKNEFVSTKKQKVGDEWVTVEEKSAPVDEGDEFTQFCKAYVAEGEKWANWVKDSPNLQNEVRALWSQLLLVAQMKGNDFAVPASKLRQWQRALAERIIIA